MTDTVKWLLVITNGVALTLVPRIHGHWWPIAYGLIAILLIWVALMIEHKKVGPAWIPKWMLSLTAVVTLLLGAFFKR